MKTTLFAFFVASAIGFVALAQTNPALPPPMAGTGMQDMKSMSAGDVQTAMRKLWEDHIT